MSEPLHGSNQDRTPINGGCGDEIDVVESLLRSAADYVQPDDLLRPKIIEAVHEEVSRRNAWRPMLRRGLISVSATLLVMMVGQVVGTVTQSPVSVQDVQQRALEKSESQDISLDWALTEVIADMRQGASGSHQQASTIHAMKSGPEN